MSSMSYIAATTDEKEENIEKGIESRNRSKSNKNETFLNKIKRNRRLVAVVSVLLLLGVFLFIAFTIFNNSNSEENKQLNKFLNITETEVSRQKENNQNNKDLDDSNKTKTLAGTWKFESSEGLDEFLQEMGVNFFIRQFAKLAKPTWIISNNGDSWTISRTGGREQPPITFKDREEFAQRTQDGDLTSYVIIESPRKQTQVSTGPLGETISTRELLDDDTMKTTVKKKNGKTIATTVFKRE